MEAADCKTKKAAIRTGCSTRFIFSIDVECRTNGEPNADIWGSFPNENDEFGIVKIMDLLDSYSSKGTFFFDVYNVEKFGESTLRSVAQAIHQRGHDLQLHTHPRAMFGFYGMSHASLQDQVRILRTGMEMLFSWTGKMPKAHRAGAFAANEDTLRASQRVGLLADCSLSGGSHNSSILVKKLGCVNWIQKVGGIWVFPVTYYTQIAFAFWRSRRILDIEGSSLSEIKHVVQWATKHRVPTVCLLMHSFSLCRKGKPNYQVINRFERLLQWLHEQPEVQVNTIADICESLKKIPLGKSMTGAAYTGLRLTWLRALGSWRDGWKNRLVATAGIIAIAVILFACFWLWVTIAPSLLR